MRRLIAAALAAAALAAPTGAHALSCAPPPPPAEAVEQVDVLFEGRAVAQPRPGVWLFEVDAVHLGELGARVEIVNGTGPWAWTYELRVRRLIAAHRDGDLLRTGPCQAVAGGSKALLDWLRTNRTPAPTAPAPSTPPNADVERLPAPPP